MAVNAGSDFCDWGSIPSTKSRMMAVDKSATEYRSLYSDLLLFLD